jgi:hypothetical protein
LGDAITLAGTRTTIRRYATGYDYWRHDPAEPLGNFLARASMTVERRRRRPSERPRTATERERDEHRDALAQSQRFDLATDRPFGRPPALGYDPPAADLGERLALHALAGAGSEVPAPRG